MAIGHLQEKKMNDARDWIDELVDELTEERDKLRVRVHLAKMEASDEWEELEEKIEKLESKARAVRKATADSAEDVGAAVKLLGQEIKDGFKKIAGQL
jgi:SMC interacting uncharacterized protein involved in chromosome segregation